MGRKVTIYTRAYNTKPYLKQCIESVLTQTYSNFEYILVDNGCTDGSSQIMADYAAADKRIHLIRFEENRRVSTQQILPKFEMGDYFTVLDSDDWWEPDYLERMINFLIKNDLDLAVTGTIQYLEAHHISQVMRKLEKPTILTQKQFAQYYPKLWTFPSTVWASIMKLDMYLDTPLPWKYSYGVDTMNMLQYIKQCSRIGIDNSALYHYRIHPKSVSYQYDPTRFNSNIAIYEHIREFLELHHTFDTPKQEWLKQVHLASMLATLQLLKDAKVSEDEKIAECARIAAHPLTATALTSDCDERKQWFALMREIVFHALSSGTLSDAESLHTVFQVLSPRSCGAVQSGSLGLFAQEASLRDALQADDWDRLSALIIELITQKKYSEQYDLGEILYGMIPDSLPLHGIADTRFFREYAENCMLILKRNYADALEQMTGLLFERQKLYDGERFLNIYLTLAALENHVPAFIFGKLQLAKLFLRQDRREECRAVVDELVEMGIDNDELTALHQQLEGAQ